MKFEIGSLVKAREREWVVLPESRENMIILRPLGGTADQISGIYLPLETVEPAHFHLPDPEDNGDYRSCRLLRDAMRLGFRSSTGPFRSFARLNVEPRPYQLVPLLMALKMDPIRLLIADDVGVGKTIEAGVIVRELLDRGLARRLAVICPPHLVEQWQEELEEKFRINAQAVTSGSATRLERNCSMDQTLFDIYPHVVVSLDFIKSDKRRDDFKRTCPELVIIDEAHTCAFGAVGRGRQQRHQLVKGLAENPQRHMIFLTATPHSGNQNAFHSLTGFLHKDFENLPPGGGTLYAAQTVCEDFYSSPGDGACAGLPKNENSYITNLTEDLSQEKYLRRLSHYMVQRRREDIASYLDTETLFPGREAKEETYTLSPEYKKLFNRVLEYARESVTDKSGGKLRERVRWWSALALLRALASSPAAAASALRTRAAPADTLSIEEANEIGQRTVLDLIQDEGTDSSDITPGSQIEDENEIEKPVRRRLLKMARDAEALKGPQDTKLQKTFKIVKDLIKDHFRPVIFCRFIHTAEYLAEELKEKLGPEVTITAVTGLIPSEERELRVLQLAGAEKPVLVATDCLSEGINLQEHFDAVFHYDLSWNPTRHEQREGRVDRFGQPQPIIRVVTFYGIDNQIDGIVLDVLIRKHKAIRDALNISIPVPTGTNQVIEAIFEGLLLREHSGSVDQYLPGFEEFFKPQKEQLHEEWDAFSQKEKNSRKMFTHSSIKVEQVAQELAAVRSAMGGSTDVENFCKIALTAHGVTITKDSGSDVTEFYIARAPAGLKEALGITDTEYLNTTFKLPAKKGTIYLHRTHPMVEGLARFVTDTALEPSIKGAAKRCGVIRTDEVKRRTTLLLVRFRFHITRLLSGEEHPLLAEECRLLAFEGAPQSAQWLDPEAAEKLMMAEPKENISPEEARYFLQKVIHDMDLLMPHIEKTAQGRAEVLMQDHLRVSAALGAKHKSLKTEPLLPPDVPGVYVYLPIEQ
jgi:superfamily II DNA or RNA helicase